MDNRDDDDDDYDSMMERMVDVDGVGGGCIHAVDGSSSDGNGCGYGYRWVVVH